MDHTDYINWNPKPRVSLGALLYLLSLTGIRQLPCCPFPLPGHLQLPLVSSLHHLACSERGPSSSLWPYAELPILGEPFALPSVPKPFTGLNFRYPGISRKPQSKKTRSPEIATKVTDFTVSGLCFLPLLSA